MTSRVRKQIYIYSKQEKKIKAKAKELSVSDYEKHGGD